MTTAFFRLGTEPIDDEVSPQVPTLAFLAGRMSDIASDQIVVSSHIYESAEKEMIRLRLAQGYSTIARAQLPQRNFLLFGIPIVLED